MEVIVTLAIYYISLRLLASMYDASTIASAVLKREQLMSVPVAAGNEA
jgi:hypothetical protein